MSPIFQDSVLQPGVPFPLLPFTFITDSNDSPTPGGHPWGDDSSGSGGTFTFMSNTFHGLVPYPTQPPSVDWRIFYTRSAVKRIGHIPLNALSIPGGIGDARS